MKQPLRLVQIGADGTPAERLDSLPEVAREACAATAALYGRVGFDPPWIGYLALSGQDVVGTCAFKTGPRLGKVEIAYFTFPPFEGQGIATAMARALIEIARTADRTMELTAQTLAGTERFERHPSQTRVSIRWRGRRSGRGHGLGVASLTDLGLATANVAKPCRTPLKFD